MATVNDTIGTDVSRDFATITAWETSLSAHSGDDCFGNCYNDSAFNESVTINDANPASITLTVPESERHDGTAGTGARIVHSTNFTTSIAIVVANTTVSWLEIDGADYNFATFVKLHTGAATRATIANSLLHDGTRNNGSPYGIENSNASGEMLNNVIYNIAETKNPSGEGAYGIKSQTSYRIDLIHNNTVFNITSANSTAASYGIWFNDNAAKKIQNNISVDTVVSGSGTGVDFQPSSASNATVSHNLSSDATAIGTGSLINKTSANQFVSTTGGSEDLHLKAGADAIDAGTDLGTTPTGVNYDIDGRDRDAEGDVWDIGADEYVAVGGAIAPTSIFYGPLVGPFGGPI